MPSLAGRLGWHRRCIVILLLGASHLVLGQAAGPAISSIQSLIRSKDYDQALLLTRKALHDQPSDFRLWTLEGIVLSIQDSTPDALAAFDKALTLSPGYAPAMKGEVQLLYQSHDKRVTPLLRKILTKDPNDPTANEMLANIEREQGDCKASIQHFTASEDLARTHPASLEAFGDCLVQAKQPDRAVPVFQQLAALLPDRTYPKYDLAVVLVSTNQNQAALDVLAPLLTEDQSDPDILSLASAAYEAIDDTPKATALLRRAILLRPDDPGLYTAFAAICLNHDSFQVGIDMVNAGLQRAPRDASLYISRGLLYAQLANYDKAEADFGTAEHLDQTQSLSAYAIELARLQTNESEEHHYARVTAEVRSQLRVHPQDARLHYLLAKLLTDQETPGGHVTEEATRSALTAIRLKPDFVEARDLLASIYLRSNQYALAAEQCRLTLKYAPSDQSALYHLIIALRHSQEGRQNEEIASLVKQLSALQQTLRQQDTDRKRFKLVEQPAAEK